MIEQNRELLVIIRAMEQRVNYLKSKVEASKSGGTYPPDDYYYCRMLEAEDILENIRIMAHAAEGMANAAEGMVGEDSDESTG